VISITIVRSVDKD